MQWLIPRCMACVACFQLSFLWPDSLRQPRSQHSAYCNCQPQPAGMLSSALGILVQQFCICHSEIFFICYKKRTIFILCYCLYFFLSSICHYRQNDRLTVLNFFVLRPFNPSSEERRGWSSPSIPRGVVLDFSLQCCIVHWHRIAGGPMRIVVE